MCMLWLALATLASAQSSPSFRIGEKKPLSQALHDLWRWVHFTQADGLPSAEVHQVVESADRTIWANTALGVSWHEGYQWQPVPCPILEKLGKVHSLQPFDDSSVLGTGTEQPVIFEKTGCRPVPLTLNGNPVRITGASRKSEGLVVVQDGSLNYYTWDGKGTALQPMPGAGKATFNSFLTISAADTVFSADSRGLNRVDRSGVTTLLPITTLKNPSHVSSLVIRSSSNNRRGEGVLSIAFPSEWMGLWRWGPTEPLHRIATTERQIARQAAISDAGEVVALYNSDEVWLQEFGKWSRIQPVPAPLRQANQVYFDSKGRLWVCSLGGLHMLRADDTLWSQLQFPFPDLHNHFLSLLVSKDGSLWAGTADGIIVISPSGQTRKIESIGSQKLGLITGLAQDSSGAIWCSSGASFEGLFRLQNETWQRFGPAEGLAATYFHSIQIDRQGRLWANSSGGGNSERPAGAFLLENGRFSRWDQSTGLINSRVYAVASAPNRDLWFATSKGISRKSGETWTHWTHKEGLRPAGIFAITVNRQGGVFFLDRRHGLGRIDAQGKLSYTQIGNGAKADAAWALREDDQGNLWVSTRAGLQLFRNQEWSNIGSSAGLETAEVWPTAFWKNHLCAGTDGGGMHCLNLALLNRPAPKLQLNPARIDASSAFLSWKLMSFEQSQIAPGIRTRYRLNGGNWSAWTNSNNATLTNLSSGNHSVEFEAIDQFGAKTAAPVALAISIPAPFYRQPVYLVPVGLSLAAALTAIYLFVTRTYQHNKKLAEKEESFRALIEYSSVGITLLDRNRRIFYASPALRIILGYEPDELLGDFRPDLIHPDDVAAVQTRLSSLTEVPGLTQRSRLRMKHKSGEYRWIEVISRNLFDNPSVGAIVTNMRDITDSTNAEMAAAEARERAERANQSKSDFLAMISHEIRTPMNGITGMCQLLLESNLNRDQRDCAETIAQSSQSLLALINDVLDFSRIEAGKLSIERAPIDLSSILNEVYQLMRVRAEEKGLNLKITYPPDAPRAFYGDALRTRQILFNLTGNAVKFTHQGEVHIEAAISYVSGSSFAISIAVSDTGIGIESEKLDMVFQKFTQADLSTTRRYGGSGLGLSICRSLASLMGGAIEAQSTVGQGSTFRLNVQLDAAPENALQLRDSKAEVLQPLAEALDVLLVEDNKVNQKLALRLLDRLGCKAQVASSGVQALALLENHHFDLILMDCQMPEMDGYEATRRIREKEEGNGRHIPIVAITANAMESDLERCLTSGMDSYLTKPIDFAKLRDALETWGIDFRGPRATSGPGAALPPS
jgi:PAS domain S-box-containing protein